jgi:hypothetical protein
MYKGKKLAPGFTMAKEQIKILCQLAMLKIILLEASCHLPAEKSDH